jgi:uncharacterized protein (DUF1501 family)
MLTRREFIGNSIGLMAAAGTIPAFLGRTCLAVGGRAANDRVLVVIQLSGGNDGLNTVVPYADDIYYNVRPKLAIQRASIVRLTDEVGLHPSLQPFQELYEDGSLAIVQGVGYPNPDRSHFRSMEVWHSGVADGYSSSGWLGRLFDHTCSNGHLPESCTPTLGITVDKTLSPAFTGNSAIGIALDDPERFYRMTRLSGAADVTGDMTGTSNLDFLRRTAMNAQVSADVVRRAADRANSTAEYPSTPFARSLQLIAKLIAGGMDTRVYYTSISGFDTHANQPGRHAQLLKTLADGVAAFNKDLRTNGQADRVLGVTFSEFGRRVNENGSRGTDHGQAAPMFLFGAPVRPGIIGAQPSLADLDRGDLRYHTDFRQVYATVIEKWLQADPLAVLGERFDALPVLG